MDCNTLTISLLDRPLDKECINPVLYCAWRIRHVWPDAVYISSLDEVTPVKDIRTTTGITAVVYPSEQEYLNKTKQSVKISLKHEALQICGPQDVLTYISQLPVWHSP